METNNYILINEIEKSISDDKVRLLFLQSRNFVKNKATFDKKNIEE